MRSFQLVTRNVDATLLHNQLLENDDLWNANDFRTKYDRTPHKDVDDIIIRYSDPEKLNPSDTSEVQNDHGAVWFPAAKVLTAVKPLVLNLMAYLESYELSRCLISRIPPGGEILAHADNVGDYVHLGDIARYHIVVQGLPGSMFKCGEEEVCMQTGEVWWFDAHKVHAIKNNSADDRIHLMADLRKWS